MMKQILLYILLIVPLFSLQCQVQIRPAPKKGYEKRIRDYVDQMRVVDTHEHLMNPAGISKSGMCDFTLLLHHYADDDLKSAGMSKPGFERILSDSLSVPDKWKEIETYWNGSSNTAYNRAVLLTAEKLFGINDINAGTVVELSARIKNAYKGDWLNQVLKDKCRLDYVVVDGSDRSFGDPAMFRYVKRFDYINIDSRGKIGAISKRCNSEMNTLDDLVSAMEKEFRESFRDGCVAVKIGVAYNRILFFDEVSREKATESLNKIMIHGSDASLPFEEVKPLQDYLTHRLLDLASEEKIPVQIHTGLQAGDGNIIENSNPVHLANLFLKFRDVKFILFHGGYPYGGELATLAKNFRNVYIDMCWLYIISPSYSERYLNEWLETVPANKIMAFGGDFHNVEGVYGHLLFARQVVANVLIEKVRSRYITENEAIKIAGMILHDNALSVLKLNKQ
jgi:hypothetical protein